MIVLESFTVRLVQWILGRGTGGLFQVQTCRTVCSGSSGQGRCGGEEGVLADDTGSRVSRAFRIRTINVRTNLRKG